MDTPGDGRWWLGGAEPPQGRPLPDTEQHAHDPAPITPLLCRLPTATYQAYEEHALSRISAALLSAHLARWLARTPDVEELLSPDGATSWGLAELQKVRARALVHLALRVGVLVRGPCEYAWRGDCCSGTVHAHHSDYQRALAVRWLCARHHGQVHAGHLP